MANCNKKGVKMGSGILLFKEATAKFAWNNWVMRRVPNKVKVK
jgi:hypothetical protein